MITRRTFAGLSVSIAIALASAVPALAETTFEKIKRTGTMVVGTEAAYPPFEFVKDGQITGFGRDLLDEIARSWGVEIKQLDLPFQASCRGFWRRNSTSWRPRSASTGAGARYAYTLPIADSTAYAIKRAGNDHIKGVEDLAGKVVATQLASAVDPVAKALDEKLKAEGKGFSELKLFPTFNDSFLAVANGTADAAMAGLPVLQNLMNDARRLRAGRAGGGYPEPERLGGAPRGQGPARRHQRRRPGAEGQRPLCRIAAEMARHDLRPARKGLPARRGALTGARPFPKGRGASRAEAGANPWTSTLRRLVTPFPGCCPQPSPT